MYWQDTDFLDGLACKSFRERYPDLSFAVKLCKLMAYGNYKLPVFYSNGVRGQYPHKHAAFFTVMRNLNILKTVIASFGLFYKVKERLERPVCYTKNLLAYTRL